MRVYLGRSKITGTKIQVVLTGLDTKTKNKKTGDTVQAWIMPAAVLPSTAVRTGSDASVCGDCPRRPRTASQTETQPCYVTTIHAPRATYTAHRGTNVEIPQTLPKPLRLGAWGDPAAVPIAVWRYLTRLAPHWTGYTHQWSKPRHQNLREFCMASVDTPGEAKQAQRAGWRTFRVKQAADPLLTGEIACPASNEAGKRTTCLRCHLCDGARPHERRKNIAINAH
jgi:hypothetical protein